MAQQRIRNFALIAHIDHGKSTLADRLLELAGVQASRRKVDQVLDSMDLERERGITIKASAVRLSYTPPGTSPGSAQEEAVELNLIDTPGHVDFSYEVSRALAACEGALLLVDAAQGVEAQTLANAYLAADEGLTIIPVLNKIDLPNAEPERIVKEIEDVIGLDCDNILFISAKHGTGVPELMDAIVSTIPQPVGDSTAPLRALIFDSWFDSYQGAVLLVRVVDGAITPRQRIRLMATGGEFEVQEVGAEMPARQSLEALATGEVGYVIAGIKDIRHAKIGDTLTDAARSASTPLPGFRLVRPMVFAGLYPQEANQHEELATALEKLALNDASLSYQGENSLALGPGFRCGFLGLLHMEIVQERLEREFDLDLITTPPTVPYRVTRRGGDTCEIDNPAELPVDAEDIAEPIVTATIHVPEEYLGNVLKLCEEKRGLQQNMSFAGAGRVVVTYELPLSEVVMDFHARLKTTSRGYASWDYDFKEFRSASIKRLDILINGQPVDALSFLIHQDKAFRQGKALVKKMREIIPRQLFEVALQASLGSRIIARETVKALRKNVTAKCYGGDITRKRKLLEKQKAGKKRMKQVGHVEIPQDAFLAILRIDD